MKELSIFVDESGDFGRYHYSSPYYIVAMVFHNQNNDITKDISKFNNELELLGFPNEHCVHNGPLIRREAPYEHLNIRERRKIINKMVAFTRQLDISFKCFYIEKKHTANLNDTSAKLSKKITKFIQENYSHFLAYDQIKVYYDNGQIELTRILSSVLNSLLPHVEFKKVLPSDYRLLQVADLVCTLHLMQLKMQNKTFSKHEIAFWGNENDLRKNYLQRIYKKEYSNKKV